MVVQNCNFQKKLEKEKVDKENKKVRTFETYFEHKQEEVLS